MNRPILVNIFTKPLGNHLNYVKLFSAVFVLGWFSMEQIAYMRRMRDLREDHDYTQAYVASILKTSQTMYARYERGANELPIHHLLTLCKLYQVSADYFLGLTDCPVK